MHAQIALCVLTLCTIVSNASESFAEQQMMRREHENLLPLMRKLNGNVTPVHRHSHSVQTGVHKLIYHYSPRLSLEGKEGMTEGRKGWRNPNVRHHPHHNQTEVRQPLHHHSHHSQMSTQPHQGISTPSKLADSIQDDYLNGPGVVVKMLECGGWYVTNNFEACALHSLKTEPATLLKFDLPLLAFVAGRHIGWLYKNIPVDNQICASPLDTGSVNCNDRATCNDTPEAFVEYFHRVHKGLPPWNRTDGVVYPGCYEKGPGSWDRAAAKQRALFQNLSTDWSEKSAKNYSLGQHRCMLYNQMMMKSSSIQEVQAIVYRNDSAWPTSIAPSHISPLTSLAMALRLQRQMLAKFNVKLPIVEMTLPAAECNWPKNTVARWNQGKQAANNSNIFIVVLDDEPRMKEAARMEKSWNNTTPSQYSSQKSSRRLSGHPSQRESHSPVASAPEALTSEATIPKNVMKVVISLVGITGAAVLWQYRSASCAPLMLAGLSTISFGLDNFLIALSGEYLHIPCAHMAVMFIFTGMTASIFHMLLYIFSPKYQSAVWESLATRKGKVGLWLVVLTGALAASAQLCSNIGFNLDPRESGPHQALSCGNVFIVGLFFYVMYGEIFTKAQLLGCTFIIFGGIVMADVLHWGRYTVSVTAFLWVFVAMILYSVSDITLRLASQSELPRQLRMLVTIQAMGLVGAASFIAVHEKNAFAQYWQSPRLLIWPLLNAIASSLGMVAVTFAFESPGAPTGVLSAIVNANSAVLVFLNWALLGYIPSLCKSIGMCLMMAGVIVFNLPVVKP
jgi:drug/metabolite transporter (DMT)-like permease